MKKHQSKEIRFSKRYKKGQRVTMIVEGVGSCHLTVGDYDAKHNRYHTDSQHGNCRHITPDSLVFLTSEESDSCEGGLSNAKSKDGGGWWYHEDNDGYDRWGGRPSGWTGGGWDY